MAAIGQAAQVARDWAGERLGFHSEVQQARAAATGAEQQRDSAESRMHAAVGRAVDARQRRDAAVQQRDAALASLVQMLAPAVPAQPREDIAAAPVAELQVQTPAQRLDGLLLAYQSGKAARVEELALRKTEHDKQLRQIRIDFYRETLQKAIDSIHRKYIGTVAGTFIALVAIVAVPAVGISVAVLALAPGAVAGTVAVGSLLGGPVVGYAGAYNGVIDSDSWDRRHGKLDCALDAFNRYVNDSMDPQKAFIEALNLHGVNNIHILGIADDIKSGVWRHPY